MKITWLTLALLLLPTAVGSQTFMGTCLTAVTVNIATGGVYCAVACTANGATDWSNACDLPLLPAIGF